VTARPIVRPYLRHAGYQRRRPEATVLYRIVQQHLATFLARADADPDRPGLPHYVRREISRFLSCGILSRGFVRVYCDTCRDSTLVAFSCKARAVCPSCAGRRMAEAAAHLVDHVLPEVPIRQWVLSLPHSIRFLIARHPDLNRLVRGIFVRAVQSFYQRRARDHGRPGGRGGAVVCTQRFDSALRLDVHFHALVLDGVYTGFGRDEPLAFHQAAPLRDEEIEALVHHIRALVIGQLQRRGFLCEDARLDPEAGTGLDELGTLQAAAIQGLIPFGPHAGWRTRLRDGDTPRRAAAKKKLCADHEGFSLHAAVRVTRPPFAQDRLSVTDAGDIVYRFRHPWRNGKTAVVMDPMTFLSRLAAQVPPPRRHVLTYHGVLAAAACKREWIVPGYAERDAAVVRQSGTKKPKSKADRIRPQRYCWAELLRRTFLVDVLACPCGARRRVLSLVCDPAQIHRYLSHLGLPTQPPTRAPPRGLARRLPFG
jgi:hypothetical protein